MAALATNENRLIDGKKVKERILSDVRKYVEIHSKKRSLGKLVSINLGDTPEIEVYIRNQKKAAESVGLDFEICNWSVNSSQNDLKKKI